MTTDDPGSGFGDRPRRMLRQLRDVMARSATQQDQLDSITRIVAADMAAEVCSIYVRRSDRTLELCATEGLNREAVHYTRLRVGEGLVGDIASSARPLALSDAQAHPKFAYRPETGEEIYQSLMGVPILRSERLVGVIVVQNRTRRHYGDEEIETLETFAMALAGLLTPGAQEGGGAADMEAEAPTRIAGTCLVPGLAIGRACLHRQTVADFPVLAEDPESEHERLETALADMHERLDRLVGTAPLEEAGAHAEVLETYRMFARDRGWLARMREAVSGGLTAEAAVRRVLNDTRARMGRISDAYLRERITDFEALADELMAALARERGLLPAAPELPDDAVLVARSLGPADLLAHDRDRLRAVVLEQGTATAHVAIVARALQIPVVGRAESVMSDVEPGDPLIVDGDNGQVFLRPQQEVREQFERSLEMRRAERARFAGNRDRPCVTRDGVGVSLMLNAGLLVDLAQLEMTGAQGVGLYRTEIAFMARRDMAGVAAQTELYRRIIEGAGARPITFRTLDAGGDKHLQGLTAGHEENPAMGWRSTRVLLDRPGVLRRQVRALLRASAGRELRLMLPMVVTGSELDQARRIIERECERARARGDGMPSRLRFGVMIEIPALMWQLDDILPGVDFAAVGSNDLFQFSFAADRSNSEVSRRYDTLAPAFLRMLHRIVKACERHSVPVSVCGEMAGRPLEALALLGLGYRTLSMAPDAIGPVKEVLMACSCADLADLMCGILETEAGHVRGILSAFARDHDIPV